jgi:hypothetical protein
MTVDGWMYVSSMEQSLQEKEQGLGGTCGEVDDGVERQRLRRALELLSYSQAESSLLSLVVQCVSVRATDTIIRNLGKMQLLSQ